MTNRIVAAAFGAAALLGAAMSGSPASAAPFSAVPALATGADAGLVQQAWHRGRPHYGPGRRHVRRCWTDTRRVWNGRRWIVRSHRVCR